MSTRPREERKILEAAAERHMRLWTREGEVFRRLSREKTKPQLGECLRPYIAVSRESGTGGSELAGLVAERLGWNVLDRDLVTYLAERYHLPRHMVDLVDETAANWFHEIFGKWLDQRMVTQAEYVVHLSKIVLLAAQHGETVFVGRGVQFLLPGDRGVTVRLVASPATRIERIMARRNLDQRAARQHMEETDRGREEFVRRYFDRDATDPHHYDLTVNLDQTNRDEAADLVVELFRRRQARRTA